MRRAIIGCGVFALLGLVAPLAGLGAAPKPPVATPKHVPSFSRDILPILADNCFACHGPDAKQAKGGLRLDLRESVTRPADSGSPAVTPGNPAKSELLRRVMATTVGERMPPADSHKPRLTARQVELLRQWIAAGAPWGRHWSFERPIAAPVPPGAAHPVDAFIRQRLAAEGLKPSPPAARETLLRRATFDLTGLPPTPGEARAFLADRSPDAYEKVVDRLLASPHFGERMAMWWLDLARYADTDGYQSDETRTNWPWRDWVVDAFNRNMPFDQFTVEQFAGDLLPNATPEQRLATCFHRNHMTNGEGGRDPEESRIDYVIDRVNTVGSVWMGLTVGCAQCHTHKFDPISHREYYQLFAFFNSIDENGQAGRAAKPYLPYRSPYAARAVAEAQELVNARAVRELAARREMESPFAGWLAERWRETRNGYRAWQPIRATELRAVEGTALAQAADGTIAADGPNPRQDDYRIAAAPRSGRLTGLRLEVEPLANGRYSRGSTGEFILTDIKVQVRRAGSTQVRDIAISGATATFSTDKAKNGNYGDIRDTLDDDPRNGWTTKGGPPGPHAAVFAFSEPLLVAPDEEMVVELRHRSTLGDANLGRFRLLVTEEPGGAVQGAGATALEQLAASQVASAEAVPPALRARLFEQFLTGLPGYVAEKAALDRAARQLAEVKKAAGNVDVMVLSERPKERESHVLLRGVWDKKGERVERDVPAAIAPWPTGQPRDRAGLARWLVSPENPLTARVAVNHLWQLLFGAGLVRTPDDFGLQGEPPTHPELLDWLAIRFASNHVPGSPFPVSGSPSAQPNRKPGTGNGKHGPWDVKALMRLLVTSETYRQSSNLTPELLRRDPENRLLARGARFRLPAWMLRDAALVHGGALNPAVGGPPVRPYQPEGVWEEIFMGRFRYEPSEGRAQHRRSLYAFWRRSIAPTFLFDSAQRRVCEVRQSRTNTPLQALTLLNDETYLEASRAMGAEAARSTHDPRTRLAGQFRRVLLRAPGERELAVLEREFRRAQAHYRKDAAAATKLVQPGKGASVPDLGDWAAYTVTASMILNLDEAITHE